jgi:hypothetical protein
MNLEVALEIVELALSLAKTEAGVEIESDATLADLLMEIAQKAAQAYHDHVGESLDPYLITAEDSI